jgi:ATP-dependent Clp protease ATP-binding subunit ClpC
MFERYTERARRVLFFARYETSQRGGLTITAEDLLLGIVREGKGIAHQLLRDAGLSYDDLIRQLASSSPAGARVATSVEIPFSQEAKDILQLTAAEADSLHHSYIGVEHLLLGLLRRGETPASSILEGHGMTLEGTRKQVVDMLSKSGALSTDDSQALG